MTRHDSGYASPPAAPALDIEAGVERLMGNRSIYLRALARFRNDYRHAAAAIRAAFDAGDLELARRLAHTLKGAAGMIEAPALTAAALALEDALRGSGRHAAALLMRLDGALAEVLRALDAMDLQAQSIAPPTQAPAETDAVARLRAMLDIGDGAAVELVFEARGALRAHLGEWEYDALHAAVAQFDYERALEMLDRPRRTG